MTMKVFEIEEAEFIARDGTVMHGKYFYLLPGVGSGNPERVFMSDERLSEQPVVNPGDLVYVFRDGFGRVASIKIAK